ncbi:MAG: hypothetical protein NXI00_20000 [Cytophagales bacterium]|nr:hypothetical protein [Cytophagales bacterium]
MSPLYVDLDVLMDRFSNKLNKAYGEFDRFADKLETAGQRLTLGVTAPLFAAAVYAKNMASDMEEATNKVDVAFKGSSDSVKDFSKTTLKEFGIASVSAMDMAALFGDMATGMGISTEAAADMSANLVGLAGDLASFKNVRLDVAETALKSIFTGETESLKNLGVVMTQANLEAFALTNGLNVKMDAMSEAEKVALRYAFVLDKTSNAQGDFARTGGGAANQTRIFQESMKEIGSSFGSIILPYFTKGITKVNELVQAFGALDAGVKENILMGAAFAAAIGPTLWGLAKIITLTKSIALALAGVSAPAIIMGAALVGVSAYVLTNWEKVRTFFYNLELQFFKFKNMVGRTLFEMGLISAETAFGDMAEGFKKVSRWSEDSATGIQGAVKAVKDFKAEMSSLLGGITGKAIQAPKAQKAASPEKSGFAKLDIDTLVGTSDLKAAKVRLAEGMAEILDIDITNAADNLDKSMEGVIRAVKVVTTKMKESSLMEFEILGKDLKGGIESALSFVGDTISLGFQSIFDAKVDFKGGFKKLLGGFLAGLGDMVMKMGEKLLAVAIMKEIAEKALVSFLAPAIPAAIGLIALGGALKGGGLALQNSASTGGITTSNFGNSAPRYNTPVVNVQVSGEFGFKNGALSAQIAHDNYRKSF